MYSRIKTADKEYSVSKFMPSSSKNHKMVITGTVNLRSRILAICSVNTLLTMIDLVQ